MCPHGRRLINGDGGLRERGRIICHCLLAEQADGLVLIDTGFGLDDMRNTRQLGTIFNAFFSPQAREAETAVEQVRALGHQPDDVRRIVVTHLDVDHAGGLPDFPGADVHVLARELDAAMSPGLLERERYVKAHWAHGPRWVRHEPDGDRLAGLRERSRARRRRRHPARAALRAHPRARRRRRQARRRQLAAALRRRVLPPRPARDATELPARPARLPEHQLGRQLSAQSATPSGFCASSPGAATSRSSCSARTIR